MPYLSTFHSPLCLYLTWSSNCDHRNPVYLEPAPTGHWQSPLGALVVYLSNDPGRRE